MNHEQQEVLKNVGDAVVIGGGFATGAASIFTEIINPLLTGLVLISTLIYTVMRIRKMIIEKKK